MKKENLFYWVVFCFVFILSGCVVRTYSAIKPRVDQSIDTGNRGYLMGQPPAGEEMKERKTTRTTQIIEIEMHSPIKFEKIPKAKAPEITSEAVELREEVQEEEGVRGNKGFIMRSIAPEISEETSLSLKKYTVQKGDTLQKISQKHYGTTKKWNKIYQANKDKLKGPNKIYPGQIIQIPVETADITLEETTENLK